MNTQSLSPDSKWFMGDITHYPTIAIHQIFEENAQHFPENIAIFCEKQKVTYQQLNQKANQLAHLLNQYSLPLDSPIGLLLPPGVDLIVSLLAILKVGCAYLPLDPQQSIERNKLIISDSQAKLIITYKNLFSKAEFQSIIPILLDSSADIIHQQPIINLHLQIKPDNLACIYYTSGSTGLPKGVMIEHKGLVRLVKDTNYISITPEDRFAQVINITFDIVAFEIWGSLLNTASLVYLGASIAKEPEKCAALIKKWNISIMVLPFSLFDFLFVSVPDCFSCLKYLVLGGEPLNPYTIAQLMKSELNRPQFVLNGYGPTENSGLTSTYLIPEQIDSQKTIPIGKPIANTTVYVFDEKQQLSNIGEIGELYTGGDGVARGYLNQSELSQQQFVINPLTHNPQDRLYRTGDIVRWRADGNLDFLGRLDSQVKIRGFRIELNAIERHLLNYPGINQCAVSAISRSHSDKYLCAFIVKTKEPLDTEQIKQFLLQYLPSYSVPERYLFVDKLPLTLNGKMDQQALSSLANEIQKPSTTENSPPGEIEEKLTTIWSEVLSLPLPLDKHQDFFAMGGHSLLVLTLQQKIKDTFDCELPWEILLPVTTIKQQTEYLARIQQATANGPLATPAVSGLEQHKTSTASASVIALQAHGDNSPLFLLPPVGGNYSCFVSLAKYLNTDQPLYVLTDHNESSPQKMVQHFIQIIKSLQTSGGYRLVGYSFGAHLAVWIANQLILEGNTVEFLGLIDGWAKLPQNYVAINFFEQQMEKLQQKLGQEVIPVELAWQRLQFLRQETLKPILCPITLFKAADNKNFEENDDDFNHWRPLAVRGIKRIIIPGNHDTLFDEHNIEKLATVLRELLLICIDKNIEEKV